MWSAVPTRSESESRRRRAAAHAATRGLFWAALFRWTLFGALSIALGGLVGQRIAARVIRKAAAVGARLPAVRAPVAPAAVVGTVAAIGLCAHVLGSGNLASGVVHLSVPALWAGSAGRVSAVEVAVFAAAALVAAHRRTAGVAALPLLVVVAAESQRSHLREADGGAGIALLIVHLTAAAIWLGALSHVMAVAWTWRANRAAAHRVLAEYARLALVLLLLVALTGTVSATLTLPSVSALTATGYGRLLMAKMAFVAVAVGCAIAGRRWLPPESDRAAERQPGRPVQAERIALAAVLAVTAVLVSVAVPGGSGSTALALPPAPIGPVVRLAALDGEVTVDVTASDGQLEVRTAVPDLGNGRGPSTDVKAVLGTRRLLLRRCGPGCFVGPAQWARGANPLTVTATSKAWIGGTATFRVPWPPVDDARVLASVVAAMRATPLLTVHEAVTSNTAGPAPLVDTHTLTGPDFVSVEPYGAAGKLVATVIGHDARTTRIAFALPDQGYFFELTVGAGHRLVGEVITTPEHRYTRTFDYPASRRR